MKRSLIIFSIYTAVLFFFSWLLDPYLMDKAKETFLQLFIKSAVVSAPITIYMYYSQRKRDRIAGQTENPVEPPPPVTEE